MGEFERRRRRLRPSSASTEPPAVPSAGEPAPEPPVQAETAVVADVEPVAPTAAAVDTVAVEPPVTRLPAAPGPRPGASRRPTSGAGVGGADDREAERGLRGLVGSGSSQVSVGAALRARDAARPSEAELAEADRTLSIVRRNWMPREELPRR